MKQWMKWVLFAAAGYNLAFGAVSLIYPQFWFRSVGLPDANYPELWQCIGMIVGVFGVGYGIAAFNPLRHWPIVLVGFLGKLFGPIGFIMSVWQGRLPLEAGWLIVTNDLIWLIPFFLILNRVSIEFRQERDREVLPLVQALQRYSARNKSLLDLSESHQLALIFLRHAGCTFCRETLSRLKEREALLLKAGLLPVIVHMGNDEDGRYLKTQYQLASAEFISDSDRTLYRSFGLRRGTWWQLFGPKIWMRGFDAGVIKGLGVGGLQGDGFQMPGVFIIHRGRIIFTEEAADASDIPNFEKLACVVPANEA